MAGSLSGQPAAEAPPLLLDAAVGLLGPPGEPWVARLRESGKHKYQKLGPEDACVVQIYGDDLGKRHTLTSELSIGRDQSNDVVANFCSNHIAADIVAFLQSVFWTHYESHQ